MTSNQTLSVSGILDISPNITPEKTYSIIFDKVSVGYGKTIILHNVSLRVERGEMVSVIGNSGAGKSTGIRCMTAQIQPKIGSAKTSGIDVKFSEVVQATIGYVPQLEHVSLYYNFSIEKNALFFGRNYGISDKAIKKRCREIMAILGLKDPKFLKKKVKFLSGGEKKRVSIMVGLVSNPEVLFLDEPTTGLDPHLRIEVLNFLHTVNQKFGTTIVIVSHDLEVVDYCSQVIIFSDGTLVDQGDPKKMVKSLPNEGFAMDILVEQISLEKEESMEKIAQIKYILHIGRNKFRFYYDNRKYERIIQEECKKLGINIKHVDFSESTFLDYFRINSKYNYYQIAEKLKKGDG